MSSESSSKPSIIVVAPAIEPTKGSESGKGWWWASALSRHFQLHIVTHRVSFEACQGQPIVAQDGWTFHVAKREILTWKFPIGYMRYAKLLEEMLGICREVITRFPIQGLCHVTLGSFRMLPRYESLGIPYTLGPLGGGECSPLGLSWSRPIPFKDRVTETLRPALNNSFALVPALRSCLGSASLVLNTSPETEAVVRRMGARRTAVVFPDAYTKAIDVDGVSKRRALKVDQVKETIRLLWQGRPLWWKCPDLALRVVRAALDRGVRVELTMISTWNPEFRKQIEAMVEKWELGGRVHFAAGMARDEYLAVMDAAHGMIIPSLHDSGGIPLIEAQAAGIPCFTFGLGGHRLAACPEAGVSASPYRVDDFVNRTVECLVKWQQDPRVWLDECEKAVRFSTHFTIGTMADDVQRLIVPLFRGNAGASPASR